MNSENEKLREALSYACKALCQVTSSDGSGHADIALSVLRMAGVDAQERESLVDGWKANVQWRIDRATRPAQAEQKPAGQQPQWISVAERLPEQFEYVVAARMYGHGIDPDMYVSMFVSGRFTVCDDALDASNYDGGACITAKVEVTHWLPLPSAPTP